jgi:hypothetical protein
MLPKNLQSVIPNTQQIELTFFYQYLPPHGFLPKERGAHALFFYYLLARRTYEERILENDVYEGELDSGTNFRQLFESIASMYNVEVYHMANFWEPVDNQCDFLQLPKLPDEERYRFRNRIVLN